MRKNITRTLEAFLAGRSHSEKTCSTDGVTLYSYRLPIAKHVADDDGAAYVELIDYDNVATMTTRSQVRAADVAVGQTTLPVVVVGEVL